MFRVSCNQTSFADALKGEIVLVQGGRSQWNCRNNVASDIYKGTQSENGTASRSQDSSSRVIKMECKIVKKNQLNVKPMKGIGNEDITIETRRVLTGFCFENGLAFYPPPVIGGISSSESKNTRLTRRLRGGTVRKSHSTFDKAAGKRTTIAETNRLTLAGVNFEQTFNRLFDASAPSTPKVSSGKRRSSFHPHPGTDDEDAAAARKKSRMSMSIRHYTMLGKEKTTRVDFHPSINKYQGSVTPSVASSISTSNASSIRLEPRRKVRLTVVENEDDLNPSMSSLKPETLLKRPQKSDLTPAMEESDVSSRIIIDPEELEVGQGLVSSVSQITGLSADERDSEWLQWTSSDDSFDEDKPPPDKSPDMTVESEPVLQTKNKRKGINEERRIQQELAAFLFSIGALDKLSYWAGLNPYTKVVLGNHSVQVKWVPRSWQFAAVCLNAFLFFIVSVGAISTLVFIYSIKEPLPLTKKILKIDFANHFPEVLFLVLISLFLFIYCVSSVTEQGFHFAEFMGRFNTAVSLTRYDVTNGIYDMVAIQFKNAAAVLCFCALLFFSGTKYADFRESCGFLGLAVLYPLNFEIRESTYFPFVEIFGLLLFLYCFIGINVVLLKFLVYAKGLSNMAKIYNLRLIYVLGDSSRKMSDGSWGRVQKHIPFVKLHAEHQIIVSLVRHLSHVSNVYIYSFLVSMTLELVLSIWILFDLFLSSNTHSIIEGLPVSKKGTVDLAVPMRVETMQGEWILSSSVMIIVTWLTYWFFGGVVHHAGEHLNTVTEYIRRHGLISCDSSKERRFILSIINSTAAKSGYWIGRSFHFNRIYLVALVGLIIGGSMVTVSFRPDRVSLNTYEVCNAHGQCTQIIASKSAESQIYNFLKHGQKPFPTYPPEYYTTPLPPLEDFGSGERYQKNIYIEKPACISYGVYPYTEVKLSVQCPANWKGEGTPYFLRLPLVHKPMLILDVLNSTEHPVFGVSRDMFNSSRKNGSFSECRSTDFPFYNYPYMDAFGKPPSTPPVDCFGDLVEPNRTDDCGNLAFPTLNVDGFRVEAKMMPIYVPNIAELQSVKGIVCCFEYGGFKGSEAQVQVCNLPNSTTFTKFCEMGSDRERLQVEHIQLHYRKLVERLHYQNKKGKVDSKGFIRKNEETIRDCLCKLYEPEVSLISEEHCACVGLQMLPCLPGYFTGIVEDYTLPCGAVKMPLLFKMSSDFSFVFPGEHERYKDVCVGDKFNDRFSHNDSLEYDYPCGLPNPVPSDSLNLTDCAGKPLITVRKDDCSNWNVSTPDAAKSGRMLGPLLKLKAFNYTLAGKKFVDTEEKNRAFTCCFEYQGQDFQTPEQKKYCNAPGVDAMNEGGWCGAVANNTKGMRNSTPFDSHLHEQLHTKLELTVRYHEAKMRYLWLEENKINEKWQRCMCTNMMTDVTFVDNQTYLDWVHKCIPLIVLPVNATEAKVLDPILNCTHKWPRYPHKEIKTPVIFTFENEIWETKDRYQKTDNSLVTNPCNMDEEYEEVYKNDGNITLYDLLLKPIEANEKDDCRNVPQKTYTDGGDLPLVTPQVRLSPEYIMAKYDENPFKNSWNVHCCYSFSDFPPEQRLICSLPNAASVKKHCNSTLKSERRLEHEYQLTRRLAVFENDAYFIGDRVNYSDWNYTLTLDSPLESLWRKCICEEDKSPDNIHDLCIREYLPPCVKSKGQLGSVTKFEKMFTQCSTQWSGLTTTINLPIVMEFFDNGSFAQVPLFEEGGVPKQCPTNNTNVITLPSEPTDCYGEEFDFGRDDCNLPYVHTPNRYNLKERPETTAELIGINQLPDLGSSEDFFCCFKYGISLNSDVFVCNQPSGDAIQRNCKFERDPDLTRYIDTLRQRRGRGLDALTLGTPFDNPARAAWTKCLCYGYPKDCENAINLQLHPCLLVQHPSEMSRSEFSNCRINKSPPWEDLNQDYVSYPIILQKIDDTDYRQVMLLGQGRCLSVGGSPPFPPDTIYQLSHLPTVDCRERPIPTFFGDDCGTPIIELPPGSNRGLIIRVSAELFRKFGVAKCVVEYQFGNQAEYFNMPSHEDYKRKCKGGPANFYNFFKIYNRIKSKVKRTGMETDSKVVHCLCYHLEYLRRRHFGSPASAQECRAHFKSFCPSIFVC